MIVTISSNADRSYSSVNHCNFIKLSHDFHFHTRKSCDMSRDLSKCGIGNGFASYCDVWAHVKCKLAVSFIVILSRVFQVAFRSLLRQLSTDSYVSNLYVYTANSCSKRSLCTANSWSDLSIIRYQSVVHQAWIANIITMYGWHL